MGRIIYTMVKNKVEFDESLMQVNEQKRLRRKLIRTQIEFDRLQNQINKTAS